MCRMENPNPAENQPQDPINDPGKNQNNQNIEETRPWQTLAKEQAEAANSGETMAAPVGRSMPSPDPKKSFQGYETTAPYPVEAAPAAPGRGENQLPPNHPTKQSKRARRGGVPWFFLPLLGMAFLLIVLLASAFGGYQAGIGQRKNAEKTQVASAVEDQFQLGLQDIEQGAYARARQRFEYVIKLDPGYPGASDKLAEVLLELNTTATPTLQPTATLTPTPDTRDVDQLYSQSQASIAASDWTGAIDNLLALRKADPSYHTVDVDGALFMALRNRGRDKILKDHDLEGGIYDLTLAEKFGPLDAEVQGLLNWSTLYITGASFWGIDWEQVVNYFSQVAPQVPNLMDASKMTATERLRQAYFEWGNTLAARGQYCQAVKQYQNSYAIAPNAEVQQAGELATKGCEGGGQPAQGTQKPGKKPKATVYP
jgi:tetratricopeptide (TPR) repeat protein